MSKDKHILPDVPYNDTNSLFERPETHKMVVTETSKVRITIMNLRLQKTHYQRLRV